MQRKIPLKWSVFVVSVVGILFSIIIIFFLVPDLLARGSYTKPAFLGEQASSGIPAHFKIPSINIDATVEYVGLTPDGAMDVPKGPSNVAWFDLGTRPGEKGSSVIAGHSGYKNNIPAVFDNLHKLKKGDKIYVEDEMGATTTFVVREIQNYDLDADAKEVFSSSDGASHLNLITCGGVWNATKKTHSKRIVVFTDKEI
jgi:LPXTG-site transpeptidase (sortase) family protein